MRAAIAPGLTGEDVLELRRSLTRAVLVMGDIGYDGARRCLRLGDAGVRVVTPGGVVLERPWGDKPRLGQRAGMSC